MSLPSRPAWLSFRRFAAFTTGLTLVLIMLGIYTAATGSGLACSAQWPLCDGGVLPNTLPSFVEWFHRLVAMVTGWFIIGTAVWAWRGDADRTTTASATLAVVLLPLQISIGAVTVTLSGMIPHGYSVPTHAAHLLAALSIFSALLIATLSAYRGAFQRSILARTHRALALSLVLIPTSLVLSRVTVNVAYVPPVQALFYGVSLVLFAALLAATLWLARTDIARMRYLTGASLALVFVHLLLGRDLVLYTHAVRRLNAAVLLLAFLLTAAAAWTVYRRSQATQRTRVTG